jgi:transcriptional regulator with XRE-family HTH domain
MVTVNDLEERVRRLEMELAGLKRQVAGTAGSASAWIERISGSMEGFPEFEQVIQLGREMRQAQCEPWRIIRMADRRIIKRVVRTTRVSAEEAERLNEIRRQAMRDIPPVQSPPGIPSRIRAARQAKKLSWKAVAQAAGLSGPSVVRDIELGHDTHVSELVAVARVLDLRLDLVSVEPWSYPSLKEWRMTEWRMTKEWQNPNDELMAAPLFDHEWHESTRMQSTFAHPLIPLIRVIRPIRG